MLLVGRRGLRGTEIENKNVVNKLAFPNILAGIWGSLGGRPGPKTLGTLGKLGFSDYSLAFVSRQGNPTQKKAPTQANPSLD